MGTLHVEDERRFKRRSSHGRRGSVPGEDGVPSYEVRKVEDPLSKYRNCCGTSRGAVHAKGQHQVHYRLLKAFYGPFLLKVK